MEDTALFKKWKFKGSRVVFLTFINARQIHPTRYWADGKPQTRDRPLLQVGLSVSALYTARIISNSTPKPNADKEWFDYYFEAIAIILLIVSLFLFLLSATLSSQTILSGRWTNERRAETICYQHKTCTNARSLHDFLGHRIFDSPQIRIFKRSFGLFYGCLRCSNTLAMS